MRPFIFGGLNLLLSESSAVLFLPLLLLVFDGGSHEHSKSQR